MANVVRPARGAGAARADVRHPDGDAPAATPTGVLALDFFSPRTGNTSSPEVTITPMSLWDPVPGKSRLQTFEGHERPVCSQLLARRQADRVRAAWIIPARVLGARTGGR